MCWKQICVCVCACGGNICCRWLLLLLPLGGDEYTFNLIKSNQWVQKIYATENSLLIIYAYFQFSWHAQLCYCLFLEFSMCFFCFVLMFGDIYFRWNFCLHFIRFKWHTRTSVNVCVDGGNDDDDVVVVSFINFYYIVHWNHAIEILSYKTFDHEFLSCCNACVCSCSILFIDYVIR